VVAQQLLALLVQLEGESVQQVAQLVAQRVLQLQEQLEQELLEVLILQLEQQGLLNLHQNQRP
jgi:hypothetical protein